MSDQRYKHGNKYHFKEFMKTTDTQSRVDSRRSVINLSDTDSLACGHAKASSAADRATYLRKPKVCFVSKNIYPLLKYDDEAQFAGGAELQQLLMGRELARRGYPVSYVTLDHGQGSVEDLDGLRAYAAFRPNDGIPGFRFFYPRLGGVLSAMRAANADIYYVRCAHYMLALVVWLTKRLGRRTVFCGANDPDFDPVALRRRLSLRDRTMYQWGLRRCDAIVVQNRAQQALLEHNYGRTACLIHNGLTAREQSAPSGNDILWIARFKPFKRPELFLELARRLPHERFVMIGGSSKAESAWFDQLATQASGLSNVEFLGFQTLSRVEKRLDQAKLLVNTSEHEGFPNTFLQAWSRGIPVLSFVDPDNLIKQERLGWAVENLDQMVQVIRDRISGTQTRSSSTIKGFFDRRLTIAAAVDRYEQVFASVVGPNAAPSSRMSSHS